MESMVFCLALAVRPICAEETYGKQRVVCLQKHHPARPGLATSPLYGTEAETDFYRLASAYYEYSSRTGVEDEPSALTQKVEGLFCPGDVTVAETALMLSVTVEALAKTSIEATKEQKAAINELMVSIKGLPNFNAISKTFSEANQGLDRRGFEARLFAVLGLLKSPSRVEDVLNHLVELAAVTRDEVKAWKQLRNKTAHGSWKSRGAQNDVDDVHKVLTLVYRLVFIHLGYDGLFTSRTSHGWETASFYGSSLKAKLPFLTQA